MITDDHSIFSSFRTCPTLVLTHAMERSEVCLLLLLVLIAVACGCALAWPGSHATGDSDSGAVEQLAG